MQNNAFQTDSESLSVFVQAFFVFFEVESVTYRGCVVILLEPHPIDVHQNTGGGVKQRENVYSPAGSIPRRLRRIRIENVFASGSFSSRVRSGVIP